jgi:hypothetical protein
MPNPYLWSPPNGRPCSRPLNARPPFTPLSEPLKPHSAQKPKAGCAKQPGVPLIRSRAVRHVGIALPSLID